MNLQPLYSGEVAVYKNIAIGAKWPIFAWGNMAQWAILPQGGPFYPLIFLKSSLYHLVTAYNVL